MFLDAGGGANGGSGFDLFDSTQCYFRDGAPGAIDNEWTFPQLAPGIYYFFGGPAWQSGTGQGRVAVSCCNTVEEDTASGAGPQEANLTLRITIDDGGNCSMERLQQLPLGPCDP